MLYFCEAFSLAPTKSSLTSFLNKKEISLSVASPHGCSCLLWVQSKQLLEQTARTPIGLYRNWTTAMGSKRHNPESLVLKARKVLSASWSTCYQHDRYILKDQSFSLLCENVTGYSMSHLHRDLHVPSENISQENLVKTENWRHLVRTVSV